MSGVAVVVGGSSGIGEAIAAELHSRGERVVSLGRRFSDNTFKFHPSNYSKWQVDITDEVLVRRCFARLESIKILVYCAGNGLFAPVLKTSTQQAQELFAVHVTGALSCINAVATKLVDGKGVAIAIGSIAAEMNLDNCALYAAAKAAQKKLWNSCAIEFRRRELRFTYIAAGAVATPLWDSVNIPKDGMMTPQSFAKAVAGLVVYNDVHVPNITLMPKGGIVTV